MNYKEKLKRLEEVKTILKSEYVGLDGIIDRLINSITPWYVTPEILTRPLVISMWGITGTGKSSIVRRLLQLLDNPSSIFMDVAEENSTRRTLTDTIMEGLSIVDDRNKTGDKISTVFVFDEFQYARTINEQGCEIDKPGTRQMWNLIDNGIIEVDEDDWNLKRLNSFLEDLGALVKDMPDAKIDKLILSDRKAVETFIQTIGFYWFEERTDKYYRRNNTDENNRYKTEDILVAKPIEELDEDNKSNEDVLSPINVIPTNVYRCFFYVCSIKDSVTSNYKRAEELYACTTLGELYEVMKNALKVTTGKKKLDFSKALIFLIGNLDEAFLYAKNTSADVKADRFKVFMDQVTIAEIKEALKTRFRAEQIARFGNVILKYPAFSSEDYKNIINLELNRLSAKFEDISGKKITFTPDITDLMYNEGVYPAQGARPVFTTINNILTPLLSSVLINFEEDREVEIGIVNPEEGYRLETKDIYFKSERNKLTKTVKLILGTDRCPKNHPTRYIIGIHEAGHAILSAYLKGVAPISIMASTSDGNGFTDDGSKTTEHINDKPVGLRREVRIEAMTNMAGVAAEELIFGEIDDGLISMGCCSDLENTYELISDAVYNKGYYEPIKVINPEVQMNHSGLPVGVCLPSKKFDARIHEELACYYDQTVKILKENKTLLIKIGRAAAEKGEITSDEFMSLVAAYGNTLTPKSMKKAKYELSSKRIEDILDAAEKEEEEY